MNEAPKYHVEKSKTGCFYKEKYFFWDISCEKKLHSMQIEAIHFRLYRCFIFGHDLGGVSKLTNILFSKVRECSHGQGGGGGGGGGGC